MADLVIEDFTAPQSVSVGETITVTFMIRNVGGVPSGDFSYEFSGPGYVLVGDDHVTRVDPGDSVPFAQVFTAPDVPGRVTVAVELDRNDLVAESDESNNVASQHVLVQLP